MNSKGAYTFRSMLGSTRMASVAWGGIQFSWVDWKIIHKQLTSREFSINSLIVVYKHFPGCEMWMQISSEEKREKRGRKGGREKDCIAQSITLSNPAIFWCSAKNSAGDFNLKFTEASDAINQFFFGGRFENRNSPQRKKKTLLGQSSFVKEYQVRQLFVQSPFCFGKKQKKSGKKVIKKTVFDLSILLFWKILSLTSIQGWGF